jgi:hypothetical protein
MLALRKCLHPGNSLNLPVRMATVAGERFLHQTTKARRKRSRSRRTPPVTTASVTIIRRSNDHDHSNDDDDEEEEESSSSWPSIQTAKNMATCHRQMDNTTIVTLAALGVHDARVEVLIRHIMAIDDVPYHQAQSTFVNTIKKANHEGMYLLELPFQIAVATSLGAGLASIPMVFHLPTVAYVNQFYVTVEEPPLTDLETWLEVGSWSWMWMEPLLGVATFSLLCLQYMRYEKSKKIEEEHLPT